MSARRFLTLLAAAIVVVAIALSVVRQRQPAPDSAGSPLVPQLGAQLATIERVTIRRGAAQPGVTLHRHGERWTVAERADYPADTAKLRRLLLAIADARVVEEKTADPANYAALGVDDPQRPDAAGTEITLGSPAGTRVLLVGRASLGGNFVRVDGAATTLLVAPPISADRDPRDWIDPHILALKAADIREVHVARAAGGRAPPRDAARTAPHEPAPAAPHADAGAALAALTALDVAPASGVDFDAAAVATATLADGSTLTLRGVAAGDRRWITVASSRDAALNERTRDVAYLVASSSFDAIFGP